MSVTKPTAEALAAARSWEFRIPHASSRFPYLPGRVAG